MTQETPQIEALVSKLREFTQERDWPQFHSPKNLSMALSVECAELMELLQWKTNQQSEACALSDTELTQIGQELADIFTYTLLLSDRLGLDLASETHNKIALNCAKYPVDKVRGKSQKYTAYLNDDEN